MGERFAIEGQVQGVGFRPFVHGLALRLGVRGRVWNDATGVKIDAFADPQVLDRFARALVEERPPMALVDRVSREPLAGAQAPADFAIVSSGAGEVRVSVTPDAAVCPDCLRELFDPRDRRYRHPFINCTHCGPRFSLIHRLPYDRPNTSMGVFALCPACRAEYENPADRRFHAQPVCCPDCGPALELRDADGVVPCADPLPVVADAIRAGQIVAVKGTGGFHLVCDARNAKAVAELRARKRRPHKPFAVMGLNLASLGKIVRISPQAAERLAASDAPVVLLTALESLPGIAPGLGRIGVMLPHTPVHYLLFHELCGKPAGPDWLGQPQSPLLVMTSANLSGDPLITDDEEACRVLAGVADLWLCHNRAIVRRVDDSVWHGGLEEPHLIRRGRGLAPRVIPLSRSGPAVLATGSYLKNAFALGRDDRAYLSQYIGDLDNPANCRALEAQIGDLMKLLDIRPELVAVDRQPDSFGWELGHRIAAELGVPVIPVQHHHAHIAAVAAELRIDRPLLGLALDGLGLGADGGLWGGELLLVDGARCDRLGHLVELPLAGGDRASREPWRLAAAALHLLGRDEEIMHRFAHQPGVAVVAEMIRRGINAPLSSSAGRWFDAAAGLLGVTDAISYEAQAAMMLESLAESRLGEAERLRCEPSQVTVDVGNRLDLRPLVASLTEERDVALGALRFHLQLARGLADWVAGAARETGVREVALAGGCFLNALLRDELRRCLQERALEVHCARQLPCNDGGLALGQLWVAQRSD